MPNKEVQRAVRLYQVFTVFITIFIWLPIYYTYQKSSGLSDAEYFQIQSLYYLMVFAFEIPTGFFADRFGYKKTLVLSAVVLAISNLLAIFFTHYWGFLAHFAAVALARAFASGSASAYLYEFLQKRGQKEEYKKVEGSARFYALMVRTLGWSAVGFAMELHQTLPYWIAFAMGMCAVLASVLLPNEGSAVDGKETLLESLKPIPGILLRTRGLVMLMGLGVGVFVLSRLSMVNLYQPMMTDKGFALTSFGWVLGIMAVFEAVAAKQTHHLSKWISDLTGAYLATLLVCAGLAGVVFSSSKPFVVASFLLFSVGFGVAFPLLRQLMNDIIPDSRYRATLLSVESMLNRIVCAGAAAAAGVYVAEGQMWPFMTGMVIFSAVVVSGIVLWLRSSGKKS